ncbi:MAG: AMP-binding protein [Verrucomicrobiota bacterium]
MNHLTKDRWRRLTKDECHYYQSKRLQRYIRDVVYPYCPYYRNLFDNHSLRPSDIQTVEDLAKIPFTDKHDLANTEEAPQRTREFVIQPNPKQLSSKPSTIVSAVLRGKKKTKERLSYEFRPVFMTSTTGRSADPVPFAYTKYDMDRLSVAGRRIMEIANGTEEMKMLNAFPYAPHLGFWQAHYAGLAIGALMVSSGGGKVMGTEGNIRMLKKLQPEVLIGVPTFLYHLLNQAVEEGIQSTQLKRIVLGGEKVETGIRRKLRELATRLGSKVPDVISTYGFTEAKVALIEPPFPHDKESSGYQVYPDMGIVEVVDPDTGEVLPLNTPGEIVYTPIDARGTIVVRYRTGDIIDGGLTYEPCPYSGSMAPRLFGRIHRRSNVKELDFGKIKGTLVDFNQLEHVLENIDHVGAWQIELRKHNNDPLDLDEVILHIERKGGEETELTREIERRFVAQTELRPNQIEFHSSREMRKRQGVGKEIKEIKILDNRAKATLTATGSRNVSPVEKPKPSHTNGTFIHAGDHI